MSTRTVEPGTYRLGDPCYSVPSDKWQGWLEQCYAGHEAGTPAEVYDGRVAGRRVVAFSTMYGDGTYYDQSGRSYGVDSGIIGLVPADMPGLSPRDVEIGLVQLVTFERAVTCDVDTATGLLVFGTVMIETGEVELDDEEEWAEEEYYDGPEDNDDEGPGEVW
jgi:hypothetical protein